MYEIEPIEDYLAPIVRYLRNHEMMQKFNETHPDFGMNPVLGPPLWEIDKAQGGLVPYSGNQNLWIFRNFRLDGMPHAQVEGTGSSAITLIHPGESSPDVRGSARQFIEVQVFYHCDPTRDSLLSAPVVHDARSKCITLHKRVKRLLDSTFVKHSGYFEMGPKEDGTSFLRVASMGPMRSLRMDEVPGGDGMVQGRASFEFEILP